MPDKMVNNIIGKGDGWTKAIVLKRFFTKPNPFSLHSKVPGIGHIEAAI